MRLLLYPPRPTVLHDGDASSASPRAANARIYQESGLGERGPMAFLEPGTMGRMPVQNAICRCVCRLSAGRRKRLFV